MELAGKTTVVTGAASGIGRALAERFAAEGARVVCADVDASGVVLAADGITSIRPDAAFAFVGDVSSGEVVAELLAVAEEAFGPVDLFCANAGIGGGYGLGEDWEHAFAVNVGAHVEAARRLVPAWIERGEGYFLSTASAAGLLTAIGSAPYTATKHAAVAFAEWLSITYGDHGVKVSCLCPMGVETPLLQDPLAVGPQRLGPAVIRASSRILAPEEVAWAVVEGLREERFLILPHAEVDQYVQIKAADREAWLAGMRMLQAHHMERLQLEEPA
jgi:NAD(P)-dependent dehydrogenase (short-subunit alcohol dehydrogenase family)